MEATVYVVDDDPSVLKSLRRLLESAGYKVRVFASAQEFLRPKQTDRPACLILDVSMPGLSGMQLQESLVEESISLPIIFISGHGDIPTSVRAIKSGAVDFLPKPFDDAMLLKAVREALDKSRREYAAQAEAAEAKQRLASLTPREAEVFAHVVTGKMNRQIAAELGISEKTVKVHRGRVMEKLGIWSVAELVRLAEKVGLPFPLTPNQKQKE